MASQGPAVASDADAAVPGESRRWRALRLAMDVGVTAVAFLAAAAVVTPQTFAPLFVSGSTDRLDRPCTGVVARTVDAAVPSAERHVDPLPEGWRWTCRWRSTAGATLRTTNPTLTVTAERQGWARGGSPERNASRQYAELATSQVGDSRFGQDDARARRKGLGVSVLEGVGDRAQVYVKPAGVGTTGTQATAVTVRGNVVVVSRYVAYRVPPGDVRSHAVAAAREAVAAL